MQENEALFSRHLRLASWGGREMQDLVSRTSVLLVGAGGTGGG